MFPEGEFAVAPGSYNVGTCLVLRAWLAREGEVRPLRLTSCVCVLSAATSLAPKPVALLPRHAYRKHVSDPYVVAPEKGVWPDAKPFLAGANRFQRKVFPETPGPGIALLSGWRGCLASGLQAGQQCVYPGPLVA